jgi:hypothetical protein
MTLNTVTTREMWHNNYIYELIDMFFILINTVKRYNPFVLFDVDIAFHNFSKLIYNCSSTMLSEYTKISEEY